MSKKCQYCGVKINSKQVKIGTLGVCLLLIGGFIGFKYGSTAALDLNPFVIRENSPEYKFINPILFFTIGSKEDFPEYKPLKDRVNDFIDKKIAEGKASQISLYFRNLTNESWSGIDEDVKYAPSSMLKVAVMMSYLKLAEENPSILSKLVYYKQETDPGQYFKPSNPLKSGWYTNEQLINDMIAKSDNTSAQTLIENEFSAFQKVIKDLSLPSQKDVSDIDFMSARLYSRVFRVLYNGTYLSKESSEKALKLLSNTDFKKGIVNGLPSSVPVSHKFGERTILDKEGNVSVKELHDCGIVYKTNEPYFVCIMTKGKNFDDLETILSGISNIIYNDVVTTK